MLSFRPALAGVALCVIVAVSPWSAGGQLALAGDSSAVRSEPRIRVAIPSLVEVESKLKWLIELSPDPQLKKQWKKLKQDFIDAFTDGVNDRKPIAVDIVFSSEGLSYDLRIPISDFTGESEGFLSGLRGRSYKVKLVGAETYEILEKDKKPAHMLFDKEYAWIATGNRPVPTKPPPATADLAPILALKKDIVAEVRNLAEDVPLRRTTFQAFRRHTEGSSRKRRSESQNAFELRKLLLKQVMSEAEPFLVEADQLQVSWTIDTSAATGFGRGEVSLTALPGTDLLRMIEETGTKPGFFANVAVHENPLAAARLSVSLDAIRGSHLKEFFKSLRPILDTEIETRSSKTGREALMRAMGVLFTMMEETTELRSVDAFAELFASAANKNTLICGVRAANGKRADEIIKLVPSIRTDWKVKLNAHEHAGVGIHELIVGNPDLASFQCVFKGERQVYVGTGKNAVWFAAGSESLDHLKRGIDQVTRPPAKIDPVVFRYEIKAGQLVSLFDSIQKQESSRNKPLTEDQRQLRKDIDKYTKLARDAMSACDASMSGELRRTGEKIEGFAELNECVLKCVGSILASTLKDLE